MNTNKNYSIKEFVTTFGFSEVYIRRSILQNKLVATKVNVGDSEKVEKWIISEEEALRFTTKSASRSKREDGRAKFNLYANSEEREKIEALLAENNIESPFQRANKVKESK